MDAAVTVLSRSPSSGMSDLVEGLDALLLHTVMLDSDGRCSCLSPGAEALLTEGALLTLRMSRLRCGSTAKVVAACPRTAKPIDLDQNLAPCIGCVLGQPSWPDGQRCSIIVRDSHDRTLQLRLTSMPRGDCDTFSKAAALVVIEPMPPRAAELLPDVAVLLTTAEREVATELLSGRRPTEIAHRRKVSVGTIRSQIKRIYAKLGVSGLVEFIAKARR